jgi:hypothetical protein
MAHAPKAEKAAGIAQNQRERYGSGGGEPTRAVPRKPATSDAATTRLNDGRRGISSGVGKGMKRGR